MKSLNKIFGLVGLLLCGFASSAFACSCPTVGTGSPDYYRELVKQKFTNAEVVFSGKVIEKNQFEVKFKIDSVWKGLVGDEFTMSIGTLGNGEGRLTSTSCDYYFEEKKSYLIYASPMESQRIRGQNLLAASGCGVVLFLENTKEETNFLNEINTPEKRNIKNKIN